MNIIGQNAAPHDPSKREHESKAYKTLCMLRNVRALNIPAPQRQVLTDLLLYANEHARAHPAMETLALNTGLCEKTVYRAMKALCDGGFVNRQRLHGKNYAYQVNVTRLNNEAADKADRTQSPMSADRESGVSGQRVRCQRTESPLNVPPNEPNNDPLNEARARESDDRREGDKSQASLESFALEPASGSERGDDLTVVSHTRFPPPPCSVSGCMKPMHAEGFCQTHAVEEWQRRLDDRRRKVPCSVCANAQELVYPSQAAGFVCTPCRLKEKRQREMDARKRRFGAA